MEKRISTTQLRVARRVAGIIAGNLAKRKKAEEQIKKWTDEYNRQENIICSYEAGLIADVGLRSEQIVTKVIEPTGKFDKNGRALKQTKYIINDNVRFDSDTKEYIVTIADDGDKEVAPVKDENDNEGTPCDCTEHTCLEPVQEVPEDAHELAQELDNLGAVNVTDGPVDVIQEECVETAEPVDESVDQFEEMFNH